MNMQGSLLSSHFIPMITVIGLGVALDDIKLGMTPFWISSSSEGTIQFQGVETFNFSLSTSELNDGEYSATV